LLVNGADLKNTKVCDVASPVPLTIGPDEMMGTAEAKMLESRVQCLVVIAKTGHVDGVIQIFE
jgi:CBS domain-containing protein